MDMVVCVCMRCEVFMGRSTHLLSSTTQLTHLSLPLGSISLLYLYSSLSTSPSPPPFPSLLSLSISPLTSYVLLSPSLSPQSHQSLSLCFSLSIFIPISIIFPYSPSLSPFLTFVCPFHPSSFSSLPLSSLSPSLLLSLSLPLSLSLLLSLSHSISLNSSLYLPLSVPFFIPPSPSLSFSLPFSPSLSIFHSISLNSSLHATLSFLLFLSSFHSLCLPHLPFSIRLIHPSLCLSIL